MDGGTLGAGFRGIGVERAYRIMMGTGWEGPCSPARSRWSAMSGLCIVGRDNESRAITPREPGPIIVRTFNRLLYHDSSSSGF